MKKSEPTPRLKTRPARHFADERGETGKNNPFLYTLVWQFLKVKNFWFIRRRVHIGTIDQHHIPTIIHYVI